MSELIRLHKKAVALSVSAVVIVLILYTWYFRINPLILLTINPLILVLSITTLTLSIVVAGIRLKIIHRSVYGVSLKITDYFYARLLGNLIALLTPSAIGGELARAYYLSVKTGSGLAGLFAITVFEVYIDIIVTNLLAIVFSIPYLPLSIPVIAIALSTVTTWTLVMAGLVREGLFSSIVDSFIKKLPQSIACGYEEFVETLRETVSKNVCVKILPLLILSTLTSYTLASATIYLLSTTVEQPASFIETFIAYIFSLTLGAVPSPGGAGTVEYGLSIPLKPEAVVLTRVLTYTYMVLTGVVALLKIRKR